MVEEIWRPITTTGFEGVYEISNLGRIRRTGGQLLTPAQHGRGYQSVTLADRGARKNALIHRLVLEAFVGPCPDQQESRHLNGDRADNHLSNLAWGTSSENELDKRRHGTSQIGIRNGQAKLTERQVKEIIRRYANGGVSQKTLAAVYGVQQSQISRIITGKRRTQG